MQGQTRQSEKPTVHSQQRPFAGFGPGNGDAIRRIRASREWLDLAPTLAEWVGYRRPISETVFSTACRRLKNWGDS